MIRRIRFGRFLGFRRPLGKITRQDASRQTPPSGRAPNMSPRDQLIETLTPWIANFCERTGAQVDLRVNMAPDSLAPEQAAAAIQIVQETLQRVACHCGAEANVSLQCSGTHVALSVHGRTEPAQQALPRGAETRWHALRERAEAVGGIFCMSHQAQQGTTIACVFPRILPN